MVNLDSMPPRRSLRPDACSVQYRAPSVIIALNEERKLGIKFISCAAQVLLKTRGLVELGDIDEEVFERDVVVPAYLVDEVDPGPCAEYLVDD